MARWAPKYSTKPPAKIPVKVPGDGQDGTRVTRLPPEIGGDRASELAACRKDGEKTCLLLWWWEIHGHLSLR